MLISIIVPAYNEEALLPATLEAINSAATASGEEWELIVVSDASTDATASIGEKHGAKVLSVNNRQISATRNSGARVASGDVFLFVDADTIITADCIRGIAKAVRDGAIGGGCPIRFDGKLPLYGRIANWLSNFTLRVSKTAAGACIFATREAFQKAGGFSEKVFAAEEIILTRALKRQGRFVIVNTPVMTSGRKLRAYSAMEIARIIFNIAITGRKALRTREGLEIWYARREEPRNSEN